jgi:phenylpyruvate tautomerase PptA (4-oxalocrotonate tautomerase family)
VFTSALALTSEQRARLVHSVTTIHRVEAKVSRCFVQVVFHRVEPGSIFIDGKPASPDHVWVRTDFCSGASCARRARSSAFRSRWSGGEALWLASLPADLREKLARVG